MIKNSIPIAANLSRRNGGQRILGVPFSFFSRSSATLKLAIVGLSVQIGGDTTATPRFVVFGDKGQQLQVMIAILRVVLQVWSVGFQG